MSRGAKYVPVFQARGKGFSPSDVSLILIRGLRAGRARRVPVVREALKRMLDAAAAEGCSE